MALILFTDVLAFSSPIVFPWMRNGEIDSVASRIPVPGGFQRETVPVKSFKNWLRHLPLKKRNSAVYLYNGEKKSNQSAHYSVIDMDVGDRDLQQCADAIIRLRAEYLYSTGNFRAIHFKFTSGHNASFKKWMEGYRPIIKGNKVKWRKKAKRDSSHAGLGKYLQTVFMYAGSYSLSRELRPAAVKEMQIGDVFIKGGFPGHAVIVVDMAVNRKSGKKLFILAQSYMPAQDMHILRNPENRKLSPWYQIDFGPKLRTPEWVFERNQLRRF